MPYQIEPLREAQDYFLNSCIDIADALAARHTDRWQDIYYKWCTVAELSSSPDVLIGWADTLLSRLPHVPADPASFSFNNNQLTRQQQNYYPTPSDSYTTYYSRHSNNSLSIALIEAMFTFKGISIALISLIVLIALFVVF